MVAAIEIRPENNPRRFLAAQRAFYRGDPDYVPPLLLADTWPLSPRQNPLLAHCELGTWLAWRDGAIVGRVSAVRNHLHDAHWGDAVGFFGHFEARDEATAHALLQHAESWLAARGATAFRGPVDLSTSHRCGLLLPGGEPGPPRVMMPYNPPAYADWISSYGLAGCKDLVALMVNGHQCTTERFDRLAARIQARSGAVFRQVDLKRFAAEAELLGELYRRCWQHNWGYAPMADGEFARHAKELRLIARRELLTVVEIDDEPVGFALCVPDVNQGIRACNGRLLPFGWRKLLAATRQTEYARVITLGVVPEVRKTGLDALLLHRYFHTCMRIGYPLVEASWILEDNHAMLSVLRALGGSEYRRYRLYERAL